MAYHQFFQIPFIDNLGIKTQEVGRPYEIGGGSKIGNFTFIKDLINKLGAQEAIIPGCRSIEQPIKQTSNIVLVVRMISYELLN